MIKNVRKFRMFANSLDFTLVKLPPKTSLVLGSNFGIFGWTCYLELAVFINFERWYQQLGLQVRFADSP